VSIPEEGHSADLDVGVDGGGRGKMRKVKCKVNWPGGAKHIGIEDEPETQSSPVVKS
jgi:hypothetical protein